MDINCRWVLIPKSSSWTRIQKLLWLFGFFQGLRPSSIGRERDSPTRFMQWGQLQLFRDHVNGRPTGRLLVKVKVVNLKTNKDFEETEEQLAFCTASPKESFNIQYSIPHRLILMLLRRRLLANHESLDSVFLGKEWELQIKAEAASRPVFFASRPAGVGLTGHSISAKRTSATVQVWAGLPTGSTFYAWRRMSSAVVDRALGRSVAKKFLGHSAGSHTFEEYHDEGLFDLNTVALLLGESPTEKHQTHKSMCTMLPCIGRPSKSQTRFEIVGLISTSSKRQRTLTSEMCPTLRDG